MFHIALGVLLCLHGISAGSWNYGPTHGPHAWPATCQTGLRQSPIDIRASDVDYSVMPLLHFVNYEQAGPLDLSNNGHTVVVSGFEKWNSQPTLLGGQLKTKYKLAQFHLHWAAANTHGSEHKIGGLHYPAEIHLVHIKEGISMAEALKQGDGLAVVGVFLSVGNAPEPLSLVANALDKVVEAGNYTTLSSFKPRSVLPSQRDAFYKYEGSLTTPGCDEAVQWYVLAEPISITSSQLSLLRGVANSDGESHSHNWRPTQPLNGRRVLFRPSQYDRKLFCPSSSAPSIAFSSVLPASLLLLLPLFSSQ